MGDYVRLGLLPQPIRAAEVTPEAAHFKLFKAGVKKSEESRIVSLAFAPVAPHRLAVVSGTKVAFWRNWKNRGAEAQNFKSLSKFKDMTQCVAWRSDGKLLLAGEASGTCAVVETDTYKILRRLRGHLDAVTCATFATADRTRAATGCRDGSLRIWDVATSQELTKVEAHSDSLKVVAAGPGGPDGWITAGYDGKVKLWDLRPGGTASEEAAGTAGSKLSSGCVVEVDHGNSVESLAVFPGGALVASAGGTEVKIWDMAAGGTLVHSLSDAHSKVITSVCLDPTAAVMLTVSFDGLAKIHRTATLEHLCSYRLGKPATCASWRADSKAFAIGLDDGTWLLREQVKGKEEEEAPPALTGAKADEALLDHLMMPETESVGKKRERLHPEIRGVIGAKPGLDDEVVSAHQPDHKKRETRMDFFLRKFEFRKVVEQIFHMNTPADHGLAAVNELLQRGALEKAMTEIGEELCLKGLRWVMKSLTAGDGLQQQLLLECLHTMLDHNRCLQPPCTKELIDAVAKLEFKVYNEVKIQQVLLETAGMLKTVTSS